jgi:hypothetical protein
MRRKWEYNIKTDLMETDESRSSSVGIVTGYGLDDRGSGVRFPAGAGNFSLFQTGSGSHPSSYPIDTGGCFPEVKAAVA